jgi:hypothetical protein
MCADKKVIYRGASLPAQQLRAVDLEFTDLTYQAGKLFLHLFSLGVVLRWDSSIF